MGTRSSKKRLETKVRHQRQVISKLEDGLKVAHEARGKAQKELVEAKTEIAYQKTRVDERDKQIAELKKLKGVTA